MRTCVPVTSQGSPYSRLLRALATGNPTIALAAAAELRRVPLPEALALCLLLVDDSQRYERAIVRWHVRFCLEVRGIGAGEAQLALAALRALSGPSHEAGGRALIALCQAHGLTEAGEVLERWLSQRR